jgi:hypothetical protein
MATVHVFSTLANDQLYQNWLQGGNDMPIKDVGVLIKGGTGVANDRLITPIGVATEIDDAEYEALQKNQVFLKHEKDGFITISKKATAVEKVVPDMNLKDKSAPLTASDYVNDDDAPKLN